MKNHRCVPLDPTWPSSNWHCHHIGDHNEVCNDVIHGVPYKVVEVGDQLSACEGDGMQTVDMTKISSYLLEK